MSHIDNDRRPVLAIDFKNQEIKEIVNYKKQVEGTQEFERKEYTCSFNEVSINIFKISREF